MKNNNNQIEHVDYKEKVIHNNVEQQYLTTSTYDIVCIDSGVDDDYVNDIVENDDDLYPGGGIDRDFIDDFMSETNGIVNVFKSIDDYLNNQSIQVKADIDNINHIIVIRI